MKKIQINYVSLNLLKPYKNNPRINDEAVEPVAKSIKEFGFKVPLVIDKDFNIVCGHTRYKASQQLGLEEVPCIVADDLTPSQLKAFRLADNKVSENSSWAYDKLEQELSQISDIDMSEFGFDLDDLDTDLDDYGLKQNGSLSERFIIPPFSIFDTRKKEWQDRKRKWSDIGLNSGNGRDSQLIGESYSILSKKMGLGGTSIFDPVLCEICYKWFNIPNGSIYNPFAGGSVRGIVAEKLGYKYTGIDLSKKQIEANEEQAKEIGVQPRWINDDSLNVDKYIEDNSVDMIFSCPPYADLEKYSDDPRDLSNMDYEDFKKAYFEIIKKACNKLKEDRFAIFVVGEVRDKKGAYINFVDDTKRAFIENGLVFYNDIVLINCVGSSALRCAKIFNGGRKVVKIHQNVLVFYKGNIKKIKENYKEVVNAEDIPIEDEEN